MNILFLFDVFDMLGGRKKANAPPGSGVLGPPWNGHGLDLSTVAEVHPCKERPF